MDEGKGYGAVYGKEDQIGALNAITDRGAHYCGLFAMLNKGQRVRSWCPAGSHILQVAGTLSYGDHVLSAVRTDFAAARI